MNASFFLLRAWHSSIRISQPLSGISKKNMQWWRNILFHLSRHWLFHYEQPWHGWHQIKSSLLLRPVQCHSSDKIRVRTKYTCMLGPEMYFKGIIHNLITPFDPTDWLAGFALNHICQQPHYGDVLPEGGHGFIILYPSC